MVEIIDLLSAGKQLDDIYEFLKKVTGDIKEYNRHRSNKEIKQLITELKNGIVETHIICVKIIEADKIEREMFGKPLKTNEADRKEIAKKIRRIATELTKIVAIPSVSHFLGEKKEILSNVYCLISSRAGFSRMWIEECPMRVLDLHYSSTHTTGDDDQHQRFIDGLQLLDISATQLIISLNGILESL